MDTAEAIKEFLQKLDAEATCNPRGEAWTFANGESLFNCSASARRIADAFGGSVVGYDCADNPTAEIPDPETTDGHDFAIVENRFVVDFWAASVVGILDRSIFDLSCSADRAIVLRLYGPRDAWKPVGPKRTLHP